MLWPNLSRTYYYQKRKFHVTSNPWARILFIKEGEYDLFKLLLFFVGTSIHATTHGIWKIYTWRWLLTWEIVNPLTLIICRMRFGVASAKPRISIKSSSENNIKGYKYINIDGFYSFFVWNNVYICQQNPNLGHHKKQTCYFKELCLNLFALCLQHESA